MPTKSIPQQGDPNWGAPLNAHIAQLQNPANGAINTWTNAASRPANLGPDDSGLTGVNVSTGEIERFTGTVWEVLTIKQANNISFNPTSNISQTSVQGAITNVDNRLTTVTEAQQTMLSDIQLLKNTPPQSKFTNGIISSVVGSVNITSWANPTINGDNTWQKVIGLSSVNQNQSQYNIFVDSTQYQGSSVMINLTMGGVGVIGGTHRLVASIMMHSSGGIVGGNIISTLKYDGVNVIPTGIDIRLVGGDIQVKFDKAGNTLSPTVYACKFL